jgi:flagellar protein FlgJ
MGILDIYSAINAGGVGRYDRSDAAAGGAPGTVADKVNTQMAGHRAKALAMFAAAQPGAPVVSDLVQRGPSSGEARTLPQIGPSTGELRTLEERPRIAQVAPPASNNAADIPAPGAMPAQGFVIPSGRAPTPAPATPAAPAAPNDNARLRAAIAVLNNPFSSPGAKAMAQALLSQEKKDPRDGVIKDLTIEEKRRGLGRVEIETMTAPDGTVFEREKGRPGAQWQQTIQLPQKGEDRTGYQKELDEENKARAARGERPLSIMEYRTQVGRANAPSVNIDQKQEGSFAQETGKALAKRFDGLATEGDEAAQNLALVSELRRLGQRIDFGAPAVVKSTLGRLGVKTDGISDIEAFNTLINRLTPQQRLPGAGATSDFDAKMFRESLPTLMNTPEGNAMVLDTIEKVSQNRMARGDIAMRVQMGEITPKDGMAEIRKLQAEAKALSDGIRDFGKPKAASPQAGQPAPAQSAPSGDGWQDMGNGVRIRERK